MTSRCDKYTRGGKAGLRRIRTAARKGRIRRRDRNKWLRALRGQ